MLNVFQQLIRIHNVSDKFYHTTRLVLMMPNNFIQMTLIDTEVKLTKKFLRAREILYIPSQ